MKQLVDLEPKQADLLAELARRNDKRQADFRVEGLKPSFLERLAQMFGLN